MSVAIVDYGLGNLRSVKNAFDALGAIARIVQHPDDLRSASHIVLPGVGAFGTAMTSLRVGGWVDAIEREISDGKPLIGLCLGMQLLATLGTEGGEQSGLGWIPGIVDELPAGAVRIPHIGWNDVACRPGSRMYATLGSQATFYFVHSYVFHPHNADVVNGVCEHGREFAASVEHGRIWGTQYHPEKSQKPGLRVLANFLEL